MFAETVMSSPQITVIICTRNRRESLMRTLETVREQEFEGAWEVIVVDNDSNDGTGQAVQGLAPAFPVPLRVIAETEIGLSASRNAGIAVARGDVLVLTDDDVDCHPGWLAAHADAYQDESVAGAGGRILPVLPDDAPEWLRRLLPHEIGGPLARLDFGDFEGELGKPPLKTPPIGANCSFRRRVLDGENGFRTDIGWGVNRIPGGETEFFQRLMRKGRFLYLPNAIVNHRVFEQRLTWEYYLDWQVGFGRSRVIFRPPVGRVDRLRQLVKTAAKLIGKSVEISVARIMRDETDKLLGMRQRARLKGRFLELCRF